MHWGLFRNAWFLLGDQAAVDLDTDPSVPLGHLSLHVALLIGLLDSFSSCVDVCAKVDPRGLELG